MSVVRFRLSAPVPYLDMKEALEAVLSTAIQRKTDISFRLERPKNPKMGDYASTLAFQKAKEIGMAPPALAAEWAELLSQDADVQSWVDVSVAGPFLNFKLTDQRLWTQFKTVLDSPYQLESKDPVCLEYVSANPTGPLHIGHGRWAAIGDALARILRYAGTNLHTEFYINNAGTQIQVFLESIKAAKNGDPVPENGYGGEYIEDLAALNLEDPVGHMQEQHKAVLSSMGVDFDQWFSEKSLHDGEKIPAAMQVLKDIDLAYEADSALWFRSTAFDDDKDRVLIKSDGAYTYFAVDIAYHLEKLERNFHSLITILGADHHGYLKRLTAVLEALATSRNHGIKIQWILGQLVQLVRGDQPVRLSKRKGDIVTLESLIEEIGVDATRYFLIEKTADHVLTVDLELAKTQSNENPVFYVQYAHARLSRLLEKWETDIPNPSDAIAFEDAERNLLLLAARFQDLIAELVQDLDPSKLSAYLTSLAKAFHSFYQACPVMSAESDAHKQQRVFICYQLREIFRQGLDLLGVSAPNRM